VTAPIAADGAPEPTPGPAPERVPESVPASARVPVWLLGIGPVVLIAVLIGLFSLLDAPGVTAPEGRVPEEVLAVESIRLQPGTITLEVRNEGPDPVVVAQVNVSDFYAPFTQTRTEIGPLQRSTITVDYPWIEGDPYEVSLVTSSGGKVVTPIDAAVASNEQGASFFGLMALLGLYVGVIPIALGLLWMPFVRRSSFAWVRGLLAFTIGLLAYLALDAALEGAELVANSSAFGGNLVVVIGALVAYLALEGVEGFVHRRRRAAGDDTVSPQLLALLISVGIGLHNLGEGLAIGAAYGAGSLALGAFLVIGFAIHNTTEGLAIVAPIATPSPRLCRPMPTATSVARWPADAPAACAASRRVCSQDETPLSSR